MKIVVCAKQIPDPASEYQLDPQSHFLERPPDQVLDDTDRFGIEVGLQIAQSTEGTVTVVSMGPAGNLQGIRQALAMGADKAVVVSDPALRGSDALVTARTLAAAIRREGFDLVVTGTESTDGYSGVLPQQLAELLEVPSLTFARKVSLEEGRLRIERQTSEGFDEVEAELPALVAVTAGAVEPRYPTFKGIMAAKSKPTDQLTVEDLGMAADQVGVAGSGQQIVEVRPAPERQAGQVIEDDGEAHLLIVELLEKAKVL
ncbi:MAG: electron transfer flavoprotein subunit beta/FixA family protein [Actinomycetota bacterium]|nr:electron transfer flavoprotein subunit beta/FixA family protein [Actinomycetota bacterium]